MKCVIHIFMNCCTCSLGCQTDRILETVDMASPLNASASAANTARLMRILCLHGYMQSGAIMRAKTGALRSALKGVAELVYVDAPNRVTEVPQRIREMMQASQGAGGLGI